VRALFPGASTGANRFVSHWGLSAPLGFTVYLVLLFGMTIFFGLFTVSPKDLAKRMKDGGEYFDNVAPGRATTWVLRRHVVGLSAMAGIVLVLFTGLPLAFIAQFPHLQYVLMAPGTVMILLGLLWTLREEIADTVLGTKYDFTFTSQPSKVAA
ncbi:MAG: hypothetical protein FWE61_09305, partial [Micrococcales bacterium]|nr:hypothetical protein [Micrococcales bacterium]